MYTYTVGAGVGARSARDTHTSRMESGDRNDEDPERPKRIAGLAAEIADSLDQQQKDHAGAAQGAGYAASLFRNLESTYGSVPDDPLLSGTEVSMRAFRDLTQDRGKRTAELTTDIRTFAYSMAANASVSAQMAIVAIPIPPGVTWPVLFIAPPQPLSWTPERFERYAAKLTQLDTELGKVYGSVWQKYYAGTDDPYRSALGAMRQSYDHLFRVLAPDDAVRDSPYFSTKQDGDPNQVHRDERLLFAANKFIADPLKRSAIEAGVTGALANYRRLNSLHGTKPLDAELVRQALCAMQAVIEEWVDVLFPL